jgi:hypothetical protein
VAAAEQRPAGAVREVQRAGRLLRFTSCDGRRDPRLADLAPVAFV